MTTILLPVNLFPSSDIRLSYKGLDSVTFSESGVTVPYIYSTDHAAVIKAYRDLCFGENSEKDQDYPVAVIDVCQNEGSPVQLIIFGGMGPDATLYFLQLAAEWIPSVSLRVLMLTSTPDRAHALVPENTYENAVAIDIFRAVNTYGNNVFPEARVIIPCNTAHLLADPLKDKLVSLIESLTVKVQQERVQKLCVLSTQVTKDYGIYNNLPCEVVYPNQEDMDSLTRIIYKELKGKGGVTDLSRTLLFDIISHYYDDVDAFGLCCTELPLIFQDAQFQHNLQQNGKCNKMYLDPMVEALSIIKNS